MVGSIKSELLSQSFDENPAFDILAAFKVIYEKSINRFRHFRESRLIKYDILPNFMQSFSRKILHRRLPCNSSKW